MVVATNTTGVGDLIAYRGKWLETGGHVNSIGSTGLQLREIDAGDLPARGTHCGGFAGAAGRRVGRPQSRNGSRDV